MSTVPERLKDIPISAPAWLWVAYVVGVLAIGCVLAGLSGAVASVLVAGFSFQFWTFAVHRGLKRRAQER